MPKQPRDVDRPGDVPLDIRPSHRSPRLDVEVHWKPGPRTRAWDELWSCIFASLDGNDVGEEKAA